MSRPDIDDANRESRIEGTSNVVLQGPGCIRMWREDYANLSMYSKAEWRAGLSLGGNSNLTVKHLSIANTGGDGNYVNGLKDSWLHNVTTTGAYRNGLSVISAENLLVDHSSFLDTGHFPWSASTGGTAPRAGVDLEPNYATDTLINITFRYTSLFVHLCFVTKSCQARSRHFIFWNIIGGTSRSSV